ncbi:TPA: 30S ribosomal protein S30 [Candidatus Bathyarchaeota archaeon]|nr:30S ribosomal protein S30 [Candidatus Bathyarchaeota archaeon]
MPTHGSLTKAGKVRAQTPKLEKSTLRKGKGSSLKVRSHYTTRVIHPKPTDRNGRPQKRF